LKPGGTLLITDYCKCVGSLSLEYTEYIRKRGYHIHDMKSYFVTSQILFNQRKLNKMQLLEFKGVTFN
jgi:hypothetical protein